MKNSFTISLLVLLILSFSSCELDHETEILVPEPYTYEEVNTTFHIDLPISTQAADNLISSTRWFEGHSSNRIFQSLLVKNSYNLVSFYKSDSLYAFVWVDPAYNQNISVTTDLTARSLITVLSDYLDPGYGSVSNAFNIAQTLPHYQTLVNIINSSWNGRGLTDLIYNTSFKSTLKSLVVDLSPDTTSVDLLTQKRIFRTDNPRTDNISYTYITYPTIKESGFNIESIYFDGTIAKVTIENNKRRGADAYIYKNHNTFVRKIIFGGKVQSGIISGLISEALASSKKEFELDFSNMGFNDSYDVQIVGPAWEFPWISDDRYTKPWIRTMIINQGIPFLTFIFDMKVSFASAGLQIAVDLYDLINNSVDWVVLLNQFENRPSNDPLFWADATNAMIGSLAILLTNREFVERAGISVYRLHGAALASWATRIIKNFKKYFNMLSFIGTLVEETRVFIDYFNTAYRTDYFFLKTTSGQGDMHGNWQGLRWNSPNDTWQQFFIVNCINSTSHNFHNWTYSSRYGFCELVGDGIYNPQNLTGTFIDRTFIRNEPTPGSCWGKTNDDFYLTNNKTHLIGTFVSQPGDPCQASPGNFELDKQ